MRNVHMDYQGEDHTYAMASRLAMNVAKEDQLLDPTIIAWHQCSGPEMPAR